MSDFRSPRTLARVVVVLLAIGCLVDLGSIVSCLMQSELLDRISSGDFTNDEVTANDAREAVFGGLQLLFTVTTGIAFLMWFWRAYFNLDSFGHTRAQDGGWVVAAWIVPIVSWFRPFQMTREIWHASDPDALYETDPNSTPTLIGAWWGAWVLSNVAGQIALRTSMGAETISEIQATTTAQIFASVTSAFAAPLAIFVVLGVTDRQIARSKRLGTEEVARVFE